MSQNLISTAGTTSPASPGNLGRPMCYDGTRWWNFYLNSGQSGSICYRSSADLVTWSSEATVAVSAGPAAGNIGVLYRSGAILLTFWNSSAEYLQYLRGTVSGTSISWGSATNILNVPGSLPAAPTCLDSSGIPVQFRLHSSGYNSPVRATNALSTSFADTLWGTVGSYPTAINGTTAGWIGPLASGGLLTFYNDTYGANYLIRWSAWNGSAWSTGVDIVAFSTTLSLTQWDATTVSTSATYWLGMVDASDFSFQSFDGTSWSSLTAPAWPTSGLSGGQTGSSVYLGNDGTNVYAFVIRGDANTTLSWNKWNGTAWAGWTDLDATAHVRSLPTGPAAGAGGYVPVAFAQVNGSNYDLYADSATAGASSPLAAGTASFDSSGPAGGSPFIKVTATDATGGAGGTTYQWKRSTDGGSYANLANGSGVTGATSRSLVDGSAVAGHLYSYELVYTDSASATATSGAVSAQVYPGGSLSSSTYIFCSEF